MPGSEDWVKRVVSLAQWRRGGERAPHKPLLLLYALGRLQRTGSSAVSFVDAEGDLSRLLEEFGPPRKTTPVYPFHHLTNDGLWEVRTPTGVGSPGPTLTALRAGAVGELDVEFSRSLVRDPRLFASVVRAILDANFPATIHEEIIDSVGIDLETTELAEIPTSLHLRRRRDPAFREKVLLAYEYQSAICGFDGQLFRQAVGIDAAHIRWWAADGPDEVGNALALCSLHHKLLDRGAIGLTSDPTVVVSRHFIGRNATSDAMVIALVDRPLRGPQVGESIPRPNTSPGIRVKSSEGQQG